MATLTIDTNQESNSSLRAIANFMRELAGDTVVTPIITIVDDTGDTPKSQSSAEFDASAASQEVPPAAQTQTNATASNAADVPSDPKLQALEAQVAINESKLQELGAASSAATAELDSSGRAWDERIDSSSKKTNANGTWKARRGVSKELIEQVKAELTGRSNACR